MKQRRINLFPWKWEGVVVAGGTPQSFAAWAKRSYNVTIETSMDAEGFAYIDCNKPWLLWVKSLWNIPTLAHEALHVAAGVLEARGVVLSQDSEESLTYTLEYLLDQILKKGSWRTIGK